MEVVGREAERVGIGTCIGDVAAGQVGKVPFEAKGGDLLIVVKRALVPAIGEVVGPMRVSQLNRGVP
jgi:hypothetical protein